MDTTIYQNESNICGDSAEDTALLRSMAVTAREYLNEFGWCPEIKKLFFASGTGGVFAVFLAELAKPIGGRDKYLWVVVGDLPSAYLVTDVINTPGEALESYCNIMQGWVDAVLSGAGLDNLFPVAASPTQDNALHLAEKLKFLRTKREDVCYPKNSLGK